MVAWLAGTEQHWRTAGARNPHSRPTSRVMTRPGDGPVGRKDRARRGNVADRGGVRPAFTKADGDNKADVAVGTGEGSVSKVRVYLGTNFGGGEPAQFQDL